MNAEASKTGEGFGRGGRALLVLSALVVFLSGLKLASAIVIPLMLATFLAIASAPIIPWLARHGVPRVVGGFVAFFIDIAALACFGVLVVASLNTLYLRIPLYQERLIELLEQSTQYLSVLGYEFTGAVARDWIEPARVFDFASGMFQRAAGLLANVTLVLLLLLFLLLEASGLRGKLLRVLNNPEANLGPFARTAQEMQKYLLVKAAASLVTGILVGLLLVMFDVELPLLWGLLAFALNFIPTLGSILAAIPPMLVALLMHGVAEMFAVTASYVVINFTIGNFVEPRILGRTLGLSPLIVVLSVVFWGWLLGPIGALLAVPLTMVVKIFLQESEDLRWLSVMLGPSSAPVEGVDNGKSGSEGGG